MNTLFHLTESNIESSGTPVHPTIYRYFHQWEENWFLGMFNLLFRRQANSLGHFI